MGGELVKSSVGTFLFQVGIAVVELFGLLYATDFVTPTTIGVYVKFVAVVLFTSLLVDLGMRHAAIKRISEGRDEGEYFVASVLWRAVTYSVVLVAFLPNRSRIDGYVGASVTGLLLLALLCHALRESVTAGLMGESRVAIATGLVFGTHVTKLATWGVALPDGWGLYGLIAGRIVGYAVAAAAGAILIRATFRRPTLEHFRELFRFSRYSWLSSFEVATWMWIDVLVLGAFVTTSLVGVYEISWKISGVFYFAAAAIGGVLFPRVSDAVNDGELSRAETLLQKSLRYTGFIAIPGLVGAAALASPVLRAYGPAYAAGHVILVILVGARLIHSYEVVFAKMLNGLDRPDLAFRINVAFIGFNVLGNILLVWLVGWVGAAIATCFSVLVKLVLSYSVLSDIVDVSVPWKPIGVQASSALVMGVVVVSLRESLEPLSIVRLAFVVLVGGSVYVLTIAAISGDFRSDVVNTVSAMRQ